MHQGTWLKRLAQELVVNDKVQFLAGFGRHERRAREYRLMNSVFWRGG
ncbi:MAG: hypothetical protein HY848_09575 [Betaproteobacteria bacterium]|nr:hypothetical protein [Betaproteobacteria bacterium]